MCVSTNYRRKTRSINAEWKTERKVLPLFCLCGHFCPVCNCMSLFFASAAEHAVNMDTKCAASFSGRLDTTKYLFYPILSEQLRATKLKSHCCFFGLPIFLFPFFFFFFTCHQANLHSNWIRMVFWKCNAQKLAFQIECSVLRFQTYLAV